VTGSDSFLSQLTGLFASPAAENPTGVMVESAYRHAELDARYVTCEVAPDGLKAAVRGAVAMGWAGFHCSLPHKVAVVQYLDELAESAALIGAVNCVVIRGGRLIGENTDGQGFLTSLRCTVDPRGKRVVLLGAGGAARAIAFELALAGVGSVFVVNRAREAGDGLVGDLRERTTVHASALPWDDTFAVPADTQILINATSVGLFPDVEAKPDLDYDTLPPGLIVADVIPNPPRTAFIKEVESRGCTAIDGLGMLVNQAVIGIRLWTGLDADVEVMKRALTEALVP
jgi:shikimate dehydrogenase